MRPRCDVVIPVCNGQGKDMNILVDQPILTQLSVLPSTSNTCAISLLFNVFRHQVLSRFFPRFCRCYGACGRYMEDQQVSNFPCFTKLSSTQTKEDVGYGSALSYFGGPALPTISTASKPRVRRTSDFLRIRRMILNKAGPLFQFSVSAPPVPLSISSAQARQ
jgi:hypothetical protein